MVALNGQTLRVDITNNIEYEESSSDSSGDESNSERGRHSKASIVQLNPALSQMAQQRASDPAM